MSAHTPAGAATDSPKLDRDMVIERGYDIQYAARLIELLANSDEADNGKVPLELQQLFLQARYLARQIGAHVQEILDVADGAACEQGGS